MKIDTSKVKKGTILKIDDKLFRVLDFSYMQMQQRQWSFSYKLRNLVSGWVQLLNFKSWTVFDQAEVQTKNAVFLYKNGDTYSFMENDSGEMFDLDGDFIWEDITWYLKENLDVFLTINEWAVLWVILPNTVSYKILTTVPGVKWDRANAGKKPATIETGIEVMVPLHKNEGDTITVNTLTWDVN